MGDYVNRLARFYDVMRDNATYQDSTRLPQFQEDDFSDDAFFKRFRFTKDGFNHLVNFIGDDIPEPENNRGRPLSPRTQLLHGCTPLQYATGSFQIVHGDLQGVSQPSASRIVRSVLGVLPSSEPSVFPVFGMFVVHKIGGGGGNAHYRRYTTH